MVFINKKTGEEISEQEFLVAQREKRVISFGKKSGVFYVELGDNQEASIMAARSMELRNILSSYTEDVIQIQMGLEVPDWAERQKRFAAAHDELRKLEGKVPRGRHT